MRNAVILMVLLVSSFSLTACVSGRPKQDAYTDKAGVAQPIENAQEACERACDMEYDRCGDSEAARRSLDATQGIFGASAGCNKSMSSCLSRCKGR